MLIVECCHHLFCCNQNCYCVGMVSQIIQDLAEAVPIALPGTRCVYRFKISQVETNANTLTKYTCHMHTLLS